MRSALILGGFVAAALLLAAGYVVWLVFGGGPAKLSAERALASRSYTADTPLSIGDILDVPLPRPRNRLELAGNPAYLRTREAVLKFLYERHRFVEAA